MKKPVALLTGLLVLALGVGACGGGEASPTPVVTPSPGATQTPSATPTPTLEPITLKLVTSSPNNGLASEAYSHFADLVEEYTGGQVKVDVYPGSQLFPATEQWEAVSTGAVDIYADATFWFTSYVPDAMVSYIDGLWEGYEHVYAVLEDSEVPRMLADAIEAAGSVKVLGFLPSGAVMAIMNSAREAEQFEDLNGLKVNSAPGAPPQPIYDYSGMAALPIAVEEASTAFIQGVIDAVMYPPDTLVRLSMYETGKHILYRTTMFPLYAIVVNKGSWESLPTDMQEVILDQAMPDTYDFNKVNYREGEESAMAVIEQSMETAHWASQEDTEAFVEYSLTHPIIKTQMLFVDPEILEIVDGLRPSRQ